MQSNFQKKRKELVFELDDVKPDLEKVMLIDADELLTIFKQTNENNRLVEAAGFLSEQREYLLNSMSFHGFFVAAFTAFKDHHSLVIFPDHIYQLVLEAFSIHVEQNSEQLREKFVSFAGKKKLKVRRDDFVKGSPSNPWPEVFETFCMRIKENTNKNVYEDVVNDMFSTSTSIDIIGRNISLMSITKQYFDYELITRCGFPSIILKGDKTDWELLKNKVTKLSHYMLPEFSEKWIPALHDILDQFICAYDDVVDKMFWRSMVKYYTTYGSGGDTYITGWINVLYPHVHGKFNPLCLRWNDLSKKIIEEGGPHKAKGSSCKDFSVSFCSAPVLWKYYNERFNLTFNIGFIGATFDVDTNTVTPVISWVITEAPKMIKDPSDPAIFSQKIEVSNMTLNYNEIKLIQDFRRSQTTPPPILSLTAKEIKMVQDFRADFERSMDEALGLRTKQTCHEKSSVEPNKEINTFQPENESNESDIPLWKRQYMQC